MKSPQEGIANDLYSDLNQQFADRNTDIKYAIEGFMDRWCCTVEQGERFCSIACFIKSDGTEYCIYFEQNTEIIAIGRTSSKIEVIHAVYDWVEGSELSVLHNKFLFIDRHKRAILGVRDDLVANFPELSELVKIKQELSEFCQLWFEHSDRSAYVCFWDDKEEILNITGFWNKSSGLFGIQSHDRKFLAEIVKGWVSDRTEKWV